MKTHPLSALVLDFDIYPRGSVDAHHIGEIAAAIEAGAVLPPLVICKDTKRLVDGFHRWRALRRVRGEAFDVQCIEKTYADDKDLFLDTMRYNAGHGRALTQHDKTHCLLLANKMRIKSDLVGEALNITPARMSALTSGRVGKVGSRSVPLKQTIRHMAGRSLTPEQETANQKLSGMNQLFYVNQIITLLANDLLDVSNTDLLDGLAKLRDLIDGSIAVQGAQSGRAA